MLLNGPFRRNSTSLPVAGEAKEGDAAVSEDPYMAVIAQLLMFCRILWSYPLLRLYVNISPFLLASALRNAAYKIQKRIDSSCQLYALCQFF